MICTGIGRLSWKSLFLVLTISSFCLIQEGYSQNARPFFEKKDHITCSKELDLFPYRLLVIPKKPTQNYIVTTTFDQISKNHSGRISVYELNRLESGYEFNSELNFSVTTDSLGNFIATPIALSYTGDGINNPFRIYAALQADDVNTSLIVGYLLDNQELTPIEEATVKAAKAYSSANAILVTDTYLIYSFGVHKDGYDTTIEMNLVIEKINTTSGGIDSSSTPKVINIPLPDNSSYIYVRSIVFNPLNNYVYVSFFSTPPANLKYKVLGYDLDMNSNDVLNICSYMTYDNKYLHIKSVSDLTFFHPELNEAYLAVLSSDGNDYEMAISDISQPVCGEMSMIPPEKNIVEPIKSSSDEFGTVFNNETKLLVAALTTYMAADDSYFTSGLEAWRVGENGKRTAIEGRAVLNLTQTQINEVSFLPDGCHLLMLGKTLSGNKVYDSFLSVYRINDPDPQNKCYRPPPPIPMEIGVSVTGASMLAIATVIVSLVVCHILRKRGAQKGYQPLENL